MTSLLSPESPAILSPLSKQEAYNRPFLASFAAKPKYVSTYIHKTQYSNFKKKRK